MQPRLPMSDSPVAEKKYCGLSEHVRVNSAMAIKDRKQGAKKGNWPEKPLQIKFPLAILMLKHHRRSFSRVAYEHD